MFMNEFMRGGKPSPSVHALLDVGTIGQVKLKAEIENQSALVKQVCERMEAAKAALGLPEFTLFSLKTRGNKIVNVSIHTKGLKCSISELKERFPVVQGKGSLANSYHFRDKSEPQRRFAELMEGCPDVPKQRSLLRQVLGVKQEGELDAILGCVGLTELADGRFLLASCETWETWNAAIKAAGGVFLTKAEVLRIQADEEEAKMKASA